VFTGVASGLLTGVCSAALAGIGSAISLDPLVFESERAETTEAVAGIAVCTFSVSAAARETSTSATPIDPSSICAEPCCTDGPCTENEIFSAGE
jgi:hypothetical protein